MTGSLHRGRHGSQREGDDVAPHPGQDAQSAPLRERRAGTTVPEVSVAVAFPTFAHALDCSRYICKLQHSSVAGVVALFVVLTCLMAALGLVHSQMLTAQNVYHTAHCFLFVLLLGFLHTRFMQDAYLLWVCYVVLFFLATFCALALPLYPSAAADKVSAEGTWQVVFVVFLAYSMMPLKSWVAAVFGFLLCCAHVAVSAVFATDFPHLRWEQVDAC